MSQLQLYIDDANPNIQCTPPSAWSDNSSELWTSGRSKVVNQFPGAKLQFTFNGTIHPSGVVTTINPLTGTTAIFHGASLNDSSFTPIIDDLPQSNYTLPTSNPPSYGEWYRTPALQPGPHTVVINDLPKVTLDYIVVVVDPSTVFQNTPVLISDSDPAIKYTGAWQQDFSRFKSLQPFTFIGDYSTRSSCNPGDTLSLDFSGTSIQLWGVFDWQSIGSVTATFIIDGQQIAQTPYSAETTSQNSIFGVQTNFQLFSKNDLTDGSHSLLVNITDCMNQRFSLDYITYQPTFTSGKDMPTTSASPDLPPGSSSHFPSGAIAGIVIGAIALVAAAGLIFWFRRRKRRTSAEPFPNSSSGVAVTRKEEVPPHMRQLRSPASRETVPGTTVDLTEGSTTNGTWVFAPNPPEFRNINELVTPLPPPAYATRNTGITTSDSTIRTTGSDTSRSPS